MQSKKPLSFEDTKLVGDFDALCRELKQPEFADRIEKPLAYWVLLSDRRLPQAFLGRSLRELISVSFDELLATPGVGHKKLVSLLMLLTRATQSAPPELDNGHSEAIPRVEEVEDGQIGEFNPAVVSEVLWERWCETVRRQNLGTQELGHLAPTLRSLPTAIWHTPLSEYMNRTLDEISHLKTHGEKRIHAVLEVFFTVHEALSHGAVQEHLDVQLVPKFVRPLEQWIASALAADTPLEEEEVRAALAEPLLAQIKLDVGEVIAKLATDRLGMSDQPKSVRRQSEELGVTRARVYQLLEDCGKVMAVRWPEGEQQLVALREKLQETRASEETHQLYNAILGLFYPLTRQTAPRMPGQRPVNVSPLVSH